MALTYEQYKEAYASPYATPENIQAGYDRYLESGNEPMGGNAPTTSTGRGGGMASQQAFISSAMESGLTQEEAQTEWDTAMAGIQPHPTPAITPPGVSTTTPTFGAGTAADIPMPEVTPAPAYEKTPEQTAFEKMYSGQLTDWVEEGGYGIPEETQNLMIQKQTDTLKAREQESLRVMRNTMERRGLTNTGLIFANEQAIRSGTSKAIAGAIADVQIKSSLMKLASFETAMGQAGQFLNYLSTQSQLAYQPEFATWQAEQMATMQKWQGQLDLLKMEINQAYQTQNMRLQTQLQGQLDAQQHQYNIQLMEMEVTAAQEMAKQEATGSISGSIVTGLFAVGAAMVGIPVL